MPDAAMRLWSLSVSEPLPLRPLSSGARPIAAGEGVWVFLPPIRARECSAIHKSPIATLQYVRAHAHYADEHEEADLASAHQSGGPLDAIRRHQRNALGPAFGIGNDQRSHLLALRNRRLNILVEFLLHGHVTRPG